LTCIDDLEIVIAEYVDWLNHRRLQGEIGLASLVEFELTFAPADTAQAA